MASIQAQFNEEDRATVKRMIEAMDKAAASEGAQLGGSNEDEPKIRGFMWNGHRNPNTTLGLYDHHNWSGQPTQPSFPKVLDWSKPIHQKFVHQGPLPGGSKAGLVYTDAEHPPARRWVVAFDAVNNKVFLDAGVIGPTDWNVVKVRLDRDGADYYEFVDPDKGGRAYATIRPDEEMGYARSLLVLFFN